jgi:hypothetical protein
VDTDGLLAGLADACASLGRFVGADELIVRRVTPGRLRAPLARALRTAAQEGHAPPGHAEPAEAR